MDSLQYRVKVPKEQAKYHGGFRDNKSILAIVMHCTAGDRADEAMGWLNRILKRGEGKASYNYLIDKDGTIWRFLPANITAYHAGKSSWPGLPSPWGSINSCSIGISFANDNGSDNNMQDDDLTQAQLESARWLCVTFCRQYDIDPKFILGHREVSPGRKTDPLPRILNMNIWREQILMELLRG